MKKTRQTFTVLQKREYAKLMIDNSYNIKEVIKISGSCNSAVIHWKCQYLTELSAVTPVNA